jgi:hypothetical protein
MAIRETTKEPTELPIKVKITVLQEFGEPHNPRTLLPKTTTLAVVKMKANNEATLRPVARANKKCRR